MKSEYNEHTNPNVYILSQMKAYYSTVPTNLIHKSVQPVYYENYLYDSDITHLILVENFDISLIYLIGLLKGVFIVTENCKKS